MSTVEREPEALPPPQAAPGGAGPAGPPPARHRIWRSESRVVAGVAGGLGDALGVAPVWTRLGFVLLALFGGLGVVVYVAAWLLMPAGPWSPTPSTVRRVIGLALLPLWLAAVAPGGGPWGPVEGAFGLVLALVGVALALWTPRPTRAEALPPPGDPWPGSAPPAAAVGASDERTDRRARAPRPPRPPRPPSPLGRLTIGVALLVAAVGTVIGEGSAEAAMLSFALATIICGVGLIVGAVAGRARWLVVPAVLLAGISVAAAAIDDLGVRINGDRRSDSWDPFIGTVGPPTRIDKAGGDTFVQLADIEAPVDGVIRVGYGEVTISAAEDVRLEVVARVGLGSIDMPSGSEEGFRRVAIYRSGPSDAPLVRYEVAVGFGSVSVWRYDADAVPPEAPALPSLPPGVVGSDGAGGVLFADGTERWADGTIVLADGSVIQTSGARTFNSPVEVLPGGEVMLPDGTKVQPDGTVILPSGLAIEPLPDQVPVTPPGAEGESATTVLAPTTSPGEVTTAASPVGQP